MSVNVNIVSAEQAIFSGVADLVVVPTLLGEVGVCKNHTPLLAFAKPGQVRLSYEADKQEELLFYISGGILEVQPSLVTILADTATRADDIDEAKALEAAERARQELENKKASLDFAKELAMLAEATAQLQVLKRLRQGRL